MYEYNNSYFFPSYSRIAINLWVNYNYNYGGYQELQRIRRTYSVSYILYI